MLFLHLNTVQHGRSEKILLERTFKRKNAKHRQSGRRLTFENVKKPICRSSIKSANVKKNQLGACERARAIWASLRALIDSCVPRGQINTEVYQLMRNLSRVRVSLCPKRKRVFSLIG